jgi:hypothetical protein
MPPSISNSKPIFKNLTYHPKDLTLNPTHLALGPYVENQTLALINTLEDIKKRTFRKRILKWLVLNPMRTGGASFKQGISLRGEPV